MKDIDQVDNTALMLDIDIQKRRVCTYLINYLHRQLDRYGRIHKLKHMFQVCNYVGMNLYVCMYKYECRGGRYMYVCMYVPVVRC